jgi:ATP-dependent DNA helicase PIF1
MYREQGKYKEKRAASDTADRLSRHLALGVDGRLPPGSAVLELKVGAQEHEWHASNCAPDSSESGGNRDCHWIAGFDFFKVPRIVLDAQMGETGLPFNFQRKQFPLRPAFAMTINKSQGQTMQNIRLYLPEPVSSHAQLYVGLSRVGSPDSIKVLVKGGSIQNAGVFTKNVVDHEVFQSESMTLTTPSVMHLENRRGCGRCSGRASTCTRARSSRLSAAR